MAQPPDALQRCRQQGRRRRKEALAELDRIRARARGRCSVYQGDLVAEAREEREGRQEQVRRDR
ncbi:MAG: hypothetical protein QME94_10445 [Anaerolineae bacterium]|nr:hypothetical protein [Anaerolineae bacterium]